MYNRHHCVTIQILIRPHVLEQHRNFLKITTGKHYLRAQILNTSQQHNNNVQTREVWFLYGNH